MSTLNQKLEGAILLSQPEGFIELSIEAVKQVFKEAGYMKSDVLESKLVSAMDKLDKDIRAEHKCMTGQEFYDRFLNAWNNTCTAIGSIQSSPEEIPFLYARIAKTAARRAAGIEEAE